MPALELGLIVGARPATEIKRVAEFGLTTCQVVDWKPESLTEEDGDNLINAARESGVRLTSFWCGYPGPLVWDFNEGPSTIGIVPPLYRTERIRALKAGADFAARLEIPSITTHVGFLPENPADPLFGDTISALQEVVRHCADLGLEFWFETGQETPVTLLRTIERIGTDNVGINLDPANLIMYGKANPVDALEVFGSHVRGVHAKDGVYPVNGDTLGEEKPIGEGKVNFAKLITELKSYGYDGPLTIEREIEGEEQSRDIRKAIEFLRSCR